MNQTRSITAGIQLGNVGMLFVLHWAVARAFGPSEYGVFALSMAIALVGAELGTVGWSRSVIRLLAEALSSDTGPPFQQIVRQSILQTLAASSICVAALLAVWFVGGGNHYLYGAVLLPMYSCHAVRKKILLQLDRPVRALGPVDIVVPGLLTLAVFTVANNFGGLLVIAALLSIAISVAMLLTLRMSLWPDRTDYSSVLTLDDNLRVSVVLLGGVLAQMLLFRLDVLFLSSFATTEQIGIYAASSRLAKLVSLPQVMVTLAFTPMVARAIADRNVAEFRRLVLASCTLSTLPAAIILAGVVAFSSEIVGLFGSAFDAGSGTLVALAIGHFVVGVAGPSASYLILTGRERLYTISLVAGCIAVAVLMYPIFLNFGLLGFAFLVAAVVAAVNLGQAAGFFREAKSLSVVNVEVGDEDHIHTGTRS